MRFVSFITPLSNPTPPTDPDFNAFERHRPPASTHPHIPIQPPTASHLSSPHPTIQIHLVDTYVNLVQRVYRIARQAKKDDDGEDDGEPTFGAAAEGIASKFGNTLTVVNPGCGFAEIAAAQKLQAL